MSITQVLEDLVGGAEASTLEWTPLAGRRRNAAGLIKLGSSASEWCTRPAATRHCGKPSISLTILWPFYAAEPEQFYASIVPLSSVGLKCLAILACSVVHRPRQPSQVATEVLNAKRELGNCFADSPPRREAGCLHCAVMQICPDFVQSLASPGFNDIGR